MREYWHRNATAVEPNWVLSVVDSAVFPSGILVGAEPLAILISGAATVPLQATPLVTPPGVTQLDVLPVSADWPAYRYYHLMLRL